MIALSILDIVPICEVVFFVEKEIGCGGSRNAELAWFGDVGYIMAFESPGGNCASWSCNDVPLFDKSFYETYLEELGPLFGLTNYKAHPYTDVLILRINTCLTCMNSGAGYYEHHTPEEYVVAEEMENAVV